MSGRLIKLNPDGSETEIGTGKLDIQYAPGTPHHTAQRERMKESAEIFAAAREADRQIAITGNAVVSMPIIFDEPSALEKFVKDATEEESARRRAEQLMIATMKRRDRDMLIWPERFKVKFAVAWPKPQITLADLERFVEKAETAVAQGALKLAGRGRA